MFGSLSDLLTMECPICGALYRDAARHQVWHDSLASVIRRVAVPDMTDEEWAEYAGSPEQTTAHATLIELARIEHAAKREVQS
jgi:sarcosine oxidase delta subunit